MKNYLRKILRLCGYKIVRYESLPYNRRVLETYEIFDFLVQILYKERLKGVFIECGFGYGRSFSVLSHFAVKFNHKIYGFDSFIGFPKVLDFDKSERKPKKGQWSVRTLNEAERYIKSLGLFNSNEQYCIQQLIINNNTINPIPDKEIALLHLDLDLYEGYKYALKIFFDQVQIGGIILFDEYNSPKWPGATRAINEFLHSNNISPDSLKQVGSKYYLIKS